MANDALNIPDLQAALAGQRDPWQAGENEITAMSVEQQKILCGFRPGPEDSGLTEREEIGLANLDAFEAAYAAGDAAAGYPVAYDLRNVGGKNYITTVKNQGGCGSCVAFGAVAAVEGTYRRSRNRPTLAVDLSEAQLFYCHARAEGRRCSGSSGGWWPGKALNAFRDKGVADDKCYPYTAGDQACTKLCSDWAARAVKITGWKRLTSAADMKTWISTKGPLVACFTVYACFPAYTGGIYRRVSSVVRGGHCVCCVGYNDAQRYWICKNSWGPSWGEGGYFRIAYGQCGIDSSMDTVNGVWDAPWQRNKRIIGLYATEQNRVAFVYVKDMGWRRISWESDHVFFRLLSMLTAAKAAGRRVDFYHEKNVIKRVYVF